MTTPGRTLSEDASKALLAPYGIPFPPEELVGDAAAGVVAARRMGYPVVAKLCGAAIAHKTERGLVRLGCSDDAAVGRAVDELLAAGRPEDDVLGVLVAPMVAGKREFIAGIHRDPQFGPTVMVGIGGVFAEALADASFRVVPFGPVDAAEMIEDLLTQALLGEFRGEPAVDRGAIAEVMLGLARVAEDHPTILSVDLNPLIITAGRPVAVDALVVFDD